MTKIALADIREYSRLVRGRFVRELRSTIREDWGKLLSGVLVLVILGLVAFISGTFRDFISATLFSAKSVVGWGVAAVLGVFYIQALMYLELRKSIAVPISSRTIAEALNTQRSEIEAMCMNAFTASTNHKADEAKLREHSRSMERALRQFRREFDRELEKLGIPGAVASYTVGDERYSADRLHSTRCSEFNELRSQAAALEQRVESLYLKYLSESMKPAKVATPAAQG